MEYKCELCGYNAKNNSNLSHHKKTKKHAENIKNKANLIRVIEYMVKDDNLKSALIDVVNEKEKLEKKNEEIINDKDKLEKDNENKTKENDDLKKDNEKLRNEIKQLVDSKISDKFIELENKIEKLSIKSSQAPVNIKINNNTNTVNIGSAQSFLTKNFPNAPSLEASKSHKFLNYNKINCEELLWNYKNKHHIKYLNDEVIEEYKKKDPRDQAVWASDIARLSYVVKETLANSDISRWIVDKEGLKTGDTIISPMLQRIKLHINAYSREISDKINKKKTYTTKQYDTFLKEQELCVDLVTEIDDGKIEREIIKCMAPHFNLDKIKINCDKQLNLENDDIKKMMDVIELDYDTDD
jgi:hypothetical protein